MTSTIDLQRPSGLVRAWAQPMRPGYAQRACRRERIVGAVVWIALAAVLLWVT